MRRPDVFAVLFTLVLGGCQRDAAPEAHSEAKATASATVSATPTAAPAPSATDVPTAASAPPSDEPVASATASSAPTETSPSPPYPPPRSATPKAPRDPVAILRSAPRGILRAADADELLKKGAPPRVHVVTAGSEPRAALRYELAAGSRQLVDMDLELGLRAKASGQTMESQMPRLTAHLDLRVGEILPSGDARIEGTLTRFTVTARTPAEEPVAAALRPHLDAAKDVKITSFVSPSGHQHDGKMALGSAPATTAQALDAVGHSVESLASPLPAEPVGEGATWTVVQRLASGGADLVQLATYVLKKREGKKVVLDVTLEQAAATEEVRSPGLPPGASARLRTFHAKGSGTTEIDLAEVAPHDGSVVVTSDLDITVMQGGAREDTSVTSSARVRFHPSTP